MSADSLPVTVPAPAPRLAVRPPAPSSRVFADRLLGDAIRKSQALTAADLLARAAAQVLDLKQGSFTDLAEALHAYRQTRAVEQSLTPLASALRHMRVSEHPLREGES